jgi:hypothetical protein
MTSRAAKGAVAPLSADAVDLTPGLIAVSPGVAVNTVTCTSCGARQADGAQRVAWHIPPWFHLGGALFFGLAYYGAVERLWTQGPLGAANHAYRDNVLHDAVLTIAPVGLPLAYVLLLALLGFVLFRARDLSLPTCSDCRRRERWTRRVFALAGPVLVVIAAIGLHLLSSLHLPILAVGVVLLPLAFARQVLGLLLPGAQGGVAIARARGGAWRVHVPPPAEAVIRRENPAALEPERQASRLYLLGWALPIVVALFVSAVLPNVVRGFACPYGAVPMQWTSGDGQFHRGCMAPSGDRHGPWRGSLRGRPLWEADFRFDRLQRDTEVWISASGDRTPTARTRSGLPAAPTDLADE